MIWKILIPVVAVAGVAVVAGGRKCSILDSAEKADRWGRKNKSRTPDRFVIVGFWEPSWLNAFCKKPTVETVAIDFKKLVGQQLEILQEQGLNTAFPDENIVIAFREKPSPQVFLAGGDGPIEVMAVKDNVQKFLAGEIEGTPVGLAGAGMTPRSMAATSIAELFKVFSE